MLENAKKILKKYYGFTSFRKGQEDVISSILQGKDTFAIMPTGAGKSICYQIPALLFSGLTLVISPLISLMKDQVDALKGMGIAASYINSSLSYSEVEKRLEKARNGEYKLLYIAPERLKSNQFCQLVKSLEISLLAIDEAHCVSQWGHDFRPSYRYISKILNEISNRPIVAAFTATATEEVKRDAIDLLTLINSNVYNTGFNRDNLSFTLIKGENKDNFILKYVEDNKEEAGIIYAATRKEVDRIANDLKKKDYKVGRYHAGLTDRERQKNQEAFLYDDLNIIVATNAFGMGIDKSNVHYVIHYNLPKNIEAYYQEAGRAGRDGEPSECILLFSPQDIYIQKYLIEQNDLSPARKIEQYNKLQKMADYCYTSKCLRRYILEYFGEENVAEECGNCSNCNDDHELIDITIEAQKIFSCIVRLKQHWGISLVAQVLKGSKNKKVLGNGFDSLSTYGIMKEYTLKQIGDMFNILIADGYLYLTEGKYPVVRLNNKAKSVLKNEKKVYQRLYRRKNKISSDNSLFEILRNLRKNISLQEQLPPYVIFHDSSLREMSKFFPTDIESMLKIKGVGEVKVEKYGYEFINVIKEYVEKNDLKEQVKIGRGILRNSEVITTKIPSYILTLKMYQSGKSISEIARERGLNSRTIEGHILRCSMEGMDVDLDFLIPEEYEQEILKAIEEQGSERLKPIKEVLPEEVNYTAIKAVLCKYKMVMD